MQNLLTKFLHHTILSIGSISLIILMLLCVIHIWSLVFQGSVWNRLRLKLWMECLLKCLLNLIIFDSFLNMFCRIWSSSNLPLSLQVFNNLQWYYIIIFKKDRRFDYLMSQGSIRTVASYQFFLHYVILQRVEQEGKVFNWLTNILFLQLKTRVTL